MLVYLFTASAYAFGDRVTMSDEFATGSMTWSAGIAIIAMCVLPPIGLYLLQRFERTA